MGQETFNKERSKKQRIFSTPLLQSQLHSQKWISLFKMTVKLTNLCFIYAVHNLTLKKKDIHVEFAFEIISLKHE